MIGYIANRLLWAVVVVAGVIVLTFVIARVVPGDPAMAWVGSRATTEQIATARSELGLDASLPVQVWRYAKGVMVGEWGTAIHTKQPVLSDIVARLPSTLELVGASIILALIFGVPMGLISARWRGRALDVGIRFGAVVGVSMPVFWMGVVLQLVFFQKLGWLPVAGQWNGDVAYQHPLTTITHFPMLDALVTGNWAMLESMVEHLVMPVLVVSAYPLGVIARMVRASALDSLGEENVKMLRACGVPERLILGRFVLKQTLNPVVAVVALVFAYSLASTFLVEAVFNRPGLGSYAADSVRALDTPAIVGVTLVVAIAFVFGNLIVDVIQAFLDPRIGARS
jgi:peptide/nickel transport system permease protein